MISTQKIFSSHSVSHQPGASTLSVEHISLRYEEIYALRDISFNLDAGERVAVVGPNGAGKSTLLKTIAGVLTPTSGMVKVYGHQPQGHSCIAYVPQRSSVDWHFPVSVLDVVLMGRIGRIGFFRYPKDKDQKFSMQCLEEVDMASLAHRQINELSGGQQQRMFIARALAQETELLLLDEPLTGLDIPAQEQILSILEKLKNKGVAVLTATHDLNLTIKFFDKAALLNHELIGYGSPEEVLTVENLRIAYGGSLHVTNSGDVGLLMGDTCCGGEHDHHA
ncbi:MAG: metal ABC transporter ATP-binding protein [Anaerolineales bacterium]|nr:metal ABC transporter ATP-binding protein [Anaerolineales bacterium]